MTGVKSSAAPSPVDPQQRTSPPRSSAHVWNPPAEMVEAEAAADRWKIRAPSDLISGKSNLVEEMTVR